MSGFYVGKLQTSQYHSNILCRGLPQRLTDEEVEARVSCMPGPLAKALLPFQRDGVRFGVQHKGRLLLADEMGVGKTVQAIALASCYQVRAACTQSSITRPVNDHRIIESHHRRRECYIS